MSARTDDPGLPSRPRPRRQVSMADVAQVAGVSAQTVSRVSNGYEGVVPETRERVIEAMRSLGYRPNAAARALKRGSFHNLGVVAFTLTSTGNASIIAAVSDAAAEHDYTVTLMRPRSRTSEEVRGAFSRLQEMLVDGVVLIMESFPEGDTGFSLPDVDHLVVLDSALGAERAVVDADQAAGARAAVEHLLALGHATVHHVTGPDHSYSAQRRRRAWQQALVDAGRPVPPAVQGNWSAASGYAAAQKLLDDPTCTAVFSANDEMALGVTRAASERGLSVPRDLSVVGFDDIPLSADFTPPLTTVHQNFADMGRACVTRLLEQIWTGEEQPGVQLVPVELVVRASTAPPRR
ncbi:MULTISPECIES: LacI family DNA-binding transcriptional regulator [Actinomyces]|uniref:LacI family DNA-binding transcriptional regulator n=1 Tax=Actinomyces respiraculi TaxID=2744574 RepID=A0A7T0LJR1_9ACTO|nr:MULTISPECIES: LacI family DNA-binding transcriptional regulator [Actinomyces]QPL05054.1 LacI family DNA-binding transcriptional regulator [Actinomyces respiraculi]